MFSFYGLRMLRLGQTLAHDSKLANASNRQSEEGSLSSDKHYIIYK